MDVLDAAESLNALNAVQLLNAPTDSQWRQRLLHAGNVSEQKTIVVQATAWEFQLQI